MRKIIFFILLASLILVSACAFGAAESQVDSTLPVEGLYYGMPVDEALAVLPQLHEVEPVWFLANHIDNNLLPNLVSELGARDFYFSSIEVFGSLASIRLRFINRIDTIIDDENYFHDYGLYAVVIEWEDSVVAGDILANLRHDFSFDWQDEWEGQFFGEVELLSNQRIDNLDEYNLNLLRSGFENWIFVRESDGYERIENLSAFAIDGPLNGTGILPNNHLHLVVGYFNPMENRLILEGGYLQGTLNRAAR